MVVLLYLIFSALNCHQSLNDSTVFSLFPFFKAWYPEYLLSCDFKCLTFLLAAFPHKEYSGKFTKISSAKKQLEPLRICSELLILRAVCPNMNNSHKLNFQRVHDSYEGHRKQVSITKLLLKENHILSLRQLKNRGELGKMWPFRSFDLFCKEPNTKYFIFDDTGLCWNYQAYESSYRIHVHVNAVLSSNQTI